MEWGSTEFVPVTDAVSVDHAGVAITAIVKDDHVIIGWSVNVMNATWTEAEQIAKEGAEGLRQWLDGFADFTVTPDTGT